MSKDIESAVRPAHYNSGDISCIDAMMIAATVGGNSLQCHKKTPKKKIVS